METEKIRNGKYGPEALYVACGHCGVGRKLPLRKDGELRRKCDQCNRRTKILPGVRACSSIG